MTLISIKLPYIPRKYNVQCYTFLVSGLRLISIHSWLELALTIPYVLFESFYDTEWIMAIDQRSICYYLHSPLTKQEVVYAYPLLLPSFGLKTAVWSFPTTRFSNPGSSARLKPENAKYFFFFILLNSHL